MIFIFSLTSRIKNHVQNITICWQYWIFIKDMPFITFASTSIIPRIPSATVSAPSPTQIAKCEKYSSNVRRGQGIQCLSLARPDEEYAADANC